MFQLLLAIIYLAFISLGLPDALLGSAWPTIYQEFSVPVSYSGGIFMVIAGGTIISSLQSDRLTRRWGTGKVTAVSVLMTAIALFGFSISHSYAALCLWAVPYGLGAGSVDASLNNYVALHYESRHMKLASLHVGNRCLHRTLCDGVCTDRRLWLEYGISSDCSISGGFDGDPDHQSAALERRFKELREWETGGTWNGGTTIPERDCFHTWSRRSDDHIFLLLCTGTDYQFVGKQLSCSETGTVGGDGSRICRFIFCRHYNRKICQRIFYHEVE